MTRTIRHHRPTIAHTDTNRNTPQWDATARDHPYRVSQHNATAHLPEAAEKRQAFRPPPTTC